MISKNKTLIKDRPRFIWYSYYKKGGHDYINMRIPVKRFSNQYAKYA